MIKFIRLQYSISFYLADIYIYIYIMFWNLGYDNIQNPTYISFYNIFQMLGPPRQQRTLAFIIFVFVTLVRNMLPEAERNVLHDRLPTTYVTRVFCEVIDWKETLKIMISNHFFIDWRWHWQCPSVIFPTLLSNIFTKV